MGTLLGSEDKGISILVHYGSWVFSQPIMTDEARMSNTVFAPHHFSIIVAVILAAISC